MTRLELSRRSDGGGRPTLVSSKGPRNIFRSDIEEEESAEFMLAATERRSRHDVYFRVLMILRSVKR